MPAHCNSWRLLQCRWSEHITMLYLAANIRMCLSEQRTNL